MRGRGSNDLGEGLLVKHSFMSKLRQREEELRRQQAQQPKERSKFEEVMLAIFGTCWDDGLTLPSEKSDPKPSQHQM